MTCEHEVIFWFLSHSLGAYLRAFGEDWIIVYNGLILYRAPSIKELGEKIAEANNLNVYLNP